MTYCHETPNCHKNAGSDLCFPVDGLQKKTWSFRCNRQKKLVRIIWNIQEIQVLRITCDHTKIILVFQWPWDRVVYWWGQYLAGGEAQCTDILILCQMPSSTNILHTINWWILNMAKDSMSTYRYLNCSNSLLPDNLLLLKLSMKLCWKF